jgi:hypothetical protein
MAVASVCFKRFSFIHLLQVFHLDVAYVCNGFKCFIQLFLQVFQMHVLKCFIVFFYVTTVASEYFKSRSDVAHRCAWEGAGGAPTTTVLVHKPGAGAHLLAERVPSDANIPYQTSER